MNNDVLLWLDILDKTKELFLTAKCQDVSKEDINKIVADLDAMERMLAPKQHFSLAFSGMTNVGKSTLLNALLGDSVAPTKNCPWSSTAVEYQYSSNKYEIVVPLENYRSLHRQFDTSQQLLSALKQFAVQGSAYQTDKPLVVRLPNELLCGDITIVDTPGFGATDGNDENALHDDVLLTYLKKREQTLRIFWIVKDNISESSVSFFKEHLAGSCSDLIVNLTDDFEGDFINLFEERYKPAVGHTVHFHYVDAKTAAKAEKEGNIELQRKTGITDLKSYLSSFATPKGRTNLIEKDLLVFFQSVSDYLYLTNHYHCEWQPTAWGTLASLLMKTDSHELNRIFCELKGV